MAADDRFRSSWSDFIGSLRTQIRVALAVGVSADEARRSGDAGAAARRYTDDSPGYMTRNGLGSLEVGAFRDRPGE